MQHHYHAHHQNLAFQGRSRSMRSAAIMRLRLRAATHASIVLTAALDLVLNLSIRLKVAVIYRIHLRSDDLLVPSNFRQPQILHPHLVSNYLTVNRILSRNQCGGRVPPICGSDERDLRNRISTSSNLHSADWSIIRSSGSIILVPITPNQLIQYRLIACLPHTVTRSTLTVRTHQSLLGICVTIDLLSKILHTTHMF